MWQNRIISNISSKYRRFSNCIYTNGKVVVFIYEKACSCAYTYFITYKMALFLVPSVLPLEAVKHYLIKGLALFMAFCVPLMAANKKGNEQGVLQCNLFCPFFLLFAFSIYVFRHFYFVNVLEKSWWSSAIDNISLLHRLRRPRTNSYKIPYLFN